MNSTFFLHCILKFLLIRIHLKESKKISHSLGKHLQHIKLVKDYCLQYKEDTNESRRKRNTPIDRGTKVISRHSQRRKDK